MYPLLFIHFTIVIIGDGDNLYVFLFDLFLVHGMIEGCGDGKVGSEDYCVGSVGREVSSGL